MFAEQLGLVTAGSGVEGPRWGHSPFSRVTRTRGLSEAPRGSWVGFAQPNFVQLEPGPYPQEMPTTPDCSSAGRGEALLELGQSPPSAPCCSPPVEWLVCPGDPGEVLQAVSGWFGCEMAQHK